MPRYIHRRPCPSDAPIAPATAPAPNPLIQLNPRQQRILAEIIDAAQRKPGGHCAIDQFRNSYCAQRRAGRTRWSVADAFRQIIAEGIHS
jgi:hypothetical protein